jgi:hypothetical protein
MRRSIASERFLSQHGLGIAPRVLGSDEQQSLLVCEFIADAVTGADLARREQFGTDLAFRAGALVGSLHVKGIAGMQVDADQPALPSADWLIGLPLPLFYESSAGELKAWKVMQDDAELVDAVSRLLASQEQAPLVPAHCDLRLDQLLVAGDRLYIADWEEFRLADPARDVGTLAGEWLHVEMTRWTEASTGTRSHDEILQQCAAGIDRAKPLISAFWSGYRCSCPRLDPRMAERSAAFAGWHMYDRMLAGASQSVRVSAVHRAVAGIGRTIMCSPSLSASTLGLC